MGTMKNENTEKNQRKQKPHISVCVRMCMCTFNQLRSGKWALLTVKNAQWIEYCARDVFECQNRS